MRVGQFRDDCHRNKPHIYFGRSQFPGTFGRDIELEVDFFTQSTLNEAVQQGLGIKIADGSYFYHNNFEYRVTEVIYKMRSRKHCSCFNSRKCPLKSHWAEQ